MEDRILFMFYGDDFTGSTDAMEALSLYGLRTILFLEIPDETLLSEFKNVQCIGIAGTSRAKSLEGMRKELIPVYERVVELNPRFFHYKVCSTFDSSPEIGSIGYAADLARKYFEHQPYHTLIAVPQLGRYTVFGNHFAKKEQKVFRLDRHPVVSNHPVTPMKEADLKLHLMNQTKQRISNVNIFELESDEKNTSSLDGDIIIYDALNESHLEKFVSRVVSEKISSTKFLIGSSGVEYAFGNYFGTNKLNKNNRDIKLNTNTVLAISGSLSEITSEQMEVAAKSGYYLEKIPYYYFGKSELPADYVEKIKQIIKEEKKVILYTADGPKDSSIKEMKKHLNYINKDEMGYIIGNNLGLWTKRIIDEIEVDMLVIAGGDTSGYVMKELNIYALETFRSVSPGAPLCIGYSRNERYNKMKIALKGGQLGGIDYYKKLIDK